MTIGDLTFTQTCGACPEQYDVYRGAEQVGYVRLRFGGLSAECPDACGEQVYYHEFPDDLKGRFEDDDEREKFLAACAAAIEARAGQAENRA